MSDQTNNQDRSQSKSQRSLSIQAAELITSRVNESPMVSEAFIFDPDKGEEALGSLYAAFETINLSDDALDILNKASDVMREEYYRDPNRNSHDSLAAALDQVNRVLADYAEQGESDWVENFHASVAAFSETNLHISTAGSGEVLLARKGHLNNIGEGMSGKERRTLHAFTTTADGTVAEHDTVILSTPQLLHLLPEERLNQLITGKDPATIVGLLRSLLDDAREDSSFAALILQFTKQPERIPAPSIPPITPQRANSYAPEARPPRPTVRPRTPITTKRSVWRNIGRIIAMIALASLEGLKTYVFPFIVQASTWTWYTFTETTQKISRTIRTRIVQWRESRTDSPVEDNETYDASDNNEIGISDYTETPLTRKQRVTGGIKHMYGSLPPLTSIRTSLPRSTKIFLILIVILGIILIGSIFRMRGAKVEESAIKEANESLQEARARYDQAEAVLMYDDRERAREEVNAALQALQEVEETPYYEEERTELRSNIQRIRDRIERITRVEAPDVVGDFADIAPNLRTIGMAVISDNIYTFNSSNNAIYELAMETGETAIVSQISQGIGYFRAVVGLAGEQTLLFATDTPGLAEFDTARGDLLRKDIDPPENIRDFRNIGVFGNRLYILAPENNQIYGYTKTLAGYADPQPWMRDDAVDIGSAIDMGIDGNIYLLYANGDIAKLLRGVPVEFEQEALLTPMEGPTRLYINEQIKRLYILDPPSKRVIVYDTLGGLSRQFSFPNAESLRDIAVDNGENTLYVLDETKVYRLDL